MTCGRSSPQGYHLNQSCWGLRSIAVLHWTAQPVSIFSNGHFETDCQIYTLTVDENKKYSMVCKSWVDMLRYRLYIFVKNKVSCYLNHSSEKLWNTEIAGDLSVSFCKFYTFTCMQSKYTKNNLSDTMREISFCVKSLIVPLLSRFEALVYSASNRIISPSK